MKQLQFFEVLYYEKFFYNDVISNCKAIVTLAYAFFNLLSKYNLSTPQKLSLDISTPDKSDSFYF